MSTHTPRSFEVPAALVAAGFGPIVDLDVLDREVEFPGEIGDWAEKVLSRENTKTLESVCAGMRLLPRGIMASVQLDDGSLLISGLVSSEGRVWDSQFNAWGVPSSDVDVVDQTVILSDDEVAFVARAMLEGADEVWFRPYLPKAFVAAPAPPQDRLGRKSKVPETPPTAQEIPAGSAIIAVVDPIDEDAVLEMLAITPGPHVLRRHDGQWFEDPAWVPVLKSVKPPKITKLTEAQVASVSAQVDRSTNDQDWEPFEVSDREQYQIFTASAYLQELQRESDEAALFSLVAVAGRELSPKDVASTEKLKRYWTVGKGAAKIRWGTPGSWRRCYRHLVKYVGPAIAPGYCTNLSKRLGGPGIATHVGDVKPIPGSADDAITAANPSGVNGYDKGMSFEESTDGVDRDYHGRFAPEGGSTRSKRRGDRSKRLDFYGSKSTYSLEDPEEEEKKDKKAETERKKKEREQERAKEEKEREVLAQIQLEIAEAEAKDFKIAAATLRIKYAEKRVEFADTPTEKANAQAALVRARTALQRLLARIRAKKAKKGSSHDPNAPKPNAGNSGKIQYAYDSQGSNNGGTTYPTRDVDPGFNLPRR